MWVEFVATGWCTKKWLRLYEAIRNLTSGDMGIMLVMIRLGVTRLVYLLDMFQGRWEKGHCDFVCVERLWVIGPVVVMLSYSPVVHVVLVLLGVDPVLRSRCGIEWKKYVALFQVSKISAGWHSRNLILAIDCSRIVTLNA